MFVGATGKTGASCSRRQRALPSCKIIRASPSSSSNKRRQASLLSTARGTRMARWLRRRRKGAKEEAMAPGALAAAHLLLPALLLMLAAASAPAAEASPTSLASVAAFAQIPGLYSRDHLITPVQGQDQFDRLVLADNDDSHSEAAHRISLVQFYMATCPDCQGFSPYFRRFVQDIGPHWRRLIRVFVVNCNDDLNINLCWRENPQLVVPLVRWYTLPHLIQALQQPTNSSSSVKQLYPSYLISVAHRDYIEKQRRDLISLRHATLRFISSIAEQLRAAGDALKLDGAHRGLWEQLAPLSWHHFQALGRPPSDSRATSPLTQFGMDLVERENECRNQSGVDFNVTLRHFVVFERRFSFLGKTIVADWSNYTCRAPANNSNSAFFLVHFSNELSLLPRSHELKEAQLYSVTLETDSRSQEDLLNLRPVATSFHLNMRRRRYATKPPLPPAATNNPRLDRLSQRMSLEQYYTKRKTLESIHRHPAYARAEPGAQVARRRLRRAPSNLLSTTPNPAVANNISLIQKQLEAENINWAPVQLYPNEELLRYTLNLAIGRQVLPEQLQHQVAGWKGGDFGEIKSSKRSQLVQVPAKDEDLSLVRLTDYYKVLDEIVHKNLRQRAELDGYHLLAATCLLRQLARHFPFQGAIYASTRRQHHSHKSVARNYLELVQRELANELHKEAAGLDVNAICSRSLKLSESLEVKLGAVRVPSKELERVQLQVRRGHDVGLPADAHFKWAYCAGSSPYLRGHTCSLWLLFHTLTVHEYLSHLESHPEHHGRNSSSDLEYKFVVPPPAAAQYSANTTAPASAQHRCDPAKPEPALLNSSSRELFVKAPQFALANIVNFVRFYMSCTNCAAHFSCMVERSLDAGLNFVDPEPADHLLFLWEAHNRVNLRTRNTHSEDPSHPKHVFPTYEACPSCYLEKPSQPAEQLGLDRLRFNKQELVNFLVARYRRSAILNNKIRIEDLFRKQPTTAPQAASSTTTTTTTTMKPLVTPTPATTNSSSHSD